MILIFLISLLFWSLNVAIGRISTIMHSQWRCDIFQIKSSAIDQTKYLNRYLLFTYMKLFSFRKLGHSFKNQPGRNQVSMTCDLRNNIITCLNHNLSRIKCKDQFVLTYYSFVSCCCFFGVFCAMFHPGYSLKVSAKSNISIIYYHILK